MRESLETGDRVAWTEHDHGIVVADATGSGDGRARPTVAVWRDGGFIGHVTRIPAALLHRLASGAKPSVGATPIDRRRRSEPTENPNGRAPPANA